MLKILLGVVQGLTEFLPVSSSGHLAVLQDWLNFRGNRLFFDVLLHLATLLAVFVYFREDILRYISSKKRLLLIILATIPTGIIGLALKPFVEGVLYKPALVAVMFVITALVVFFVDVLEGTEGVDEIPFWRALVVGVFQGLAVVPGLSRSGLTIFASLWAGIKREEAAPFSFIVAIPAIAGANFLEFLDVGSSVAFDVYDILGMAAAFLTGLLALKLFVGFLNRRSFKFFGLYLLALAVLVFVFG